MAHVSWELGSEREKVIRGGWTRGRNKSRTQKRKRMKERRK
jgi:hypothetical protein